MTRRLRLMMETAEGGLVTTSRRPTAGPPKRWALGAGPESPRVTVGGVELAYEESGSGPVVVGLHAAGQGSRDFAAIRPLLSTDCRLIALDWPGHGRSGPGRRGFCASYGAELLSGFLHALKIERAVLVGCSVGGAAAIRYAAIAPDRIAGLVLCDPAGLAPPTWLADRFCRAMANLARAGAAGKRRFRMLYPLFCRSLLRTEAALEQRERIIAAGPEMAPVLADAWERFRRPEEDVRRFAAKLACPVLFAWSKGDPIVSLDRSRAAVATVPDHRLLMFDGGHCAFLEEPAAFADRVRAFLAEEAVRQRYEPA